MGIDSSSPKLAALRLTVEKEFGKIPKVHNDFIELADSIKNKLHQHISETTLERVWNYSNRGYDSVSLHTLKLLCLYIGKRAGIFFLRKPNRFDDWSSSRILS